VLSSIGGRVALQELLDMADKAGYSGRILSLSWKEQSEPESVIGGYAESEKKGGRPVCFTIDFLPPIHIWEYFAQANS
jgi:hypothetical protein